MDLARFLPAPLALFARRHSPSAAWGWRVPAVGLRFKLVTLVVGVSLIGVFTSSFLVLTLQRQQLLETMEAALTRSSSAIAASLEHAMVRNDRVMTSQIVHRMVEREGVERVRILDASGHVRISSTQLEVGDRFRPADALCQSCHASQTPSTNQTTVVQTPEGRPVLLNITHIENLAQCQSCHGTSPAVLGILMIESPLTDLDNQLTAAFWRIGLAAILTMGLLVGLTLVALRRLVIRPVDELIAGMTEIRAGHLDYVVQPSSQDELGDLAEAFDTMRKQLKSHVQQARHLATLQERDRLAREMHDDLAQKLGYMKTRLWLTDELLAANQVAQVCSSLDELSHLADDAYKDVRDTIFDLRAAVPSGAGLVPDLDEYLSEFASQTGIETQLVCADPALVQFPADVEAQVSRIIQEALTNIRKHARAKHAWIRCQREDDDIRISIEDDGQGIDPAYLAKTHLRQFGLGIMRERAESVGGQLEIDSQPNAGTRITLRVPIHRAA